jgi:hypothetical protein
MRVGESVTIRPPVEATAFTVTQPDATVIDEPLLTLIGFGDTTQPGIYTASVTVDGEVETQAFAVNLFGTGESRIAPQTALHLGGQATAAEGEAQFTLREFWPLAALAALIVLLLEWYAYHRRLRAPAPARVVARTTAKI